MPTVKLNVDGETYQEEEYETVRVYPSGWVKCVNVTGDETHYPPSEIYKVEGRVHHGSDGY